MRYDFSPIYRSTVGFDQMFEALDRFSQSDSSPGWPAYDIERMDEDSYRISLGVAGFIAEEVELVQKENELVVTGQKKKTGDEPARYMHRGIPTNFKQTFNLAEHVRVVEADLTNGVLTIGLRRQIPEALKPRKIDISSSGPSQSGNPDDKGKPNQLGRRAEAA
jgi:molecular chaperone IbpA